ncbi:LacI family DNA-binding transcriptional regulator [Neptunitalea lumnitzerae]|uniref:LacI family transcriptional regulator n=1 Tax=Neptunitalea lumnitzerae TaxID=2965509 RepID=A0ABQ5MGI4_9FLAO|nr:LacI family DNA-binding transcriptional regulator [Neptunitalea sp. Y10]GLB48509.1 LacI family transcriptional regulator [Neptunitalea sp. Y10]
MKESKVPTLKSIAEKLNISVTTVSKALKGYSDVSPVTRQKVLDIAEELNYTPNSIAVNFRTKQSKTIGIIIPEVVHHFFSSIINGVIEEAERQNYFVIILQSNENKEMEKKQVELLISKRVDGIIMSLSNQSNDEDYLKKIIDRNIPLVLIDKISKLIDCSKVIIDDKKAAFDAVNHLINIGCKKIAHIRGPLNPQNSIDRFLGYKTALDHHNIPFDSSLVYPCKRVCYEEGYDFTKQLMNDHPDVDGIFAITDLVAVGALTYLNDQQIKIPNQVAVIGFSNWFMSSVISPKLSTIDQPGFKMGAQAFLLLKEEMESMRNAGKRVCKTITLNTDLIIRESTSK